MKLVRYEQFPFYALHLICAELHFQVGALGLTWFSQIPDEMRQRDGDN